MKTKHSVRILALALAAVLLLSTGTLALDGSYAAGVGSFVKSQTLREEIQGAEPGDEKPVSAMTDAELIEKFNIPDNWARTALIFATRNGILSTRGSQGLCPTGNTTRAEMATILSRILKTTATVDLSSYADVSTSSWYYTALSQVCALNIMTEREPGVMAPKENITREEVFVALAKLYGVCGNTRQKVYEFADWQDISSDEATLYLSGMITGGYVNGKNGYLKPQDPITRQELAQVLNNLFHRLSNTIYNNHYYGKLGLAANKVDPGAAITGTLFISNEVSKMTLENVKVTQKLIIQGSGTLQLKLVNCEIKELVLARDCVVTVEGGGVDKLTCQNSYTKLIGSVPAVNVRNMLVLGSGSTVDKMVVWSDNSKMTVTGTVNNLTVVGKNVYINGAGHIENLTVKGANLTNRCDTGSVTETIDPLLTQIKATRTDSGKATPSSPTLDITYKLTNMPAGKRDCTVTWKVNGKEVQKDRLLLSEGSKLVHTENFSSYLPKNSTTIPFTIVIDSMGETFKINGSVNVTDPGWAEAKSIRTQAIQAKIKTATTFYNGYNISARTFSGAVETVPAGTQVTILKTSQGYGARVRLPSGKVGWIAYADMSIISGQYYTTSDYSTAAKEYYVNEIVHYSSSSNYLIWVSLYTQHVNIFYGYKDHWTLVLSCRCATGRNANPTPVEDTKIQYKTSRWSYDHYYCHHVSVFDESRGFPSQPTHYDGYVYDNALGYPASGGCIRMLDADCIYIYENVPTGTTVHIY